MEANGGGDGGEEDAEDEDVGREAEWRVLGGLDVAEELGRGGHEQGEKGKKKERRTRFMERGERKMKTIHPLAKAIIVAASHRWCQANCHAVPIVIPPSLFFPPSAFFLSSSESKSSFGESPSHLNRLNTYSECSTSGSGGTNERNSTFLTAERERRKSLARRGDVRR